jgi:asparagine synthase (glutamine-hydrolysing)
MCGIVGGWWNKSGEAYNRISLSLLSLRNRGPNDSGYMITKFGDSEFALGQTRLSIIDLSNAGHQPMHSRDGRWTIVFNGEIYNYIEIRESLKKNGHIFYSDSDTEVLLNAWSEWGVEILQKLIGMYAFAIFDNQKKTLTCIRDPFGIKPLYFTNDDEGFKFSSDLPSLIILINKKLKLNNQRAYDYLVHGDYDSDEDTLFDQVNNLLPGHLILFNLSTGKLNKQEQWWFPKIEENNDVSFEQAAEILQTKFLKSVEYHLISDVPIGVSLSGGIDSSSIVCAMRLLQPKKSIQTFSYIPSNSNASEETWVDIVNSHVGAISNKIKIDESEILNDLDRLIKCQGEPFGSTSIFAQFKVYEKINKCGIIVNLDGQGGDEILGGYNGYSGPRLRSLIEKGKFFESMSFINEWSKWPNRNLMGGAKRLVAEISSDSIYKLLRRLDGSNPLPKWINRSALIEIGVIADFPKRLSLNQGSSGRRLMESLSLALTKRGLPSLLRHGDRSSMNFSVESRVPFLTIELVNFCLSLPENYLVSNKGETKSVFREAMRDIVPDAILNRKDKIGFETPEINWILKDVNQVRKILSSNLNISFFNQAEVLKEFELIIDGKKPYSWEVWRWINFCRWHRIFID